MSRKLIPTAISAPSQSCGDIWTPASDMNKLTHYTLPQNNFSGFNWADVISCFPFFNENDISCFDLKRKGCARDRKFSPVKVQANSYLIYLNM